MVDYPKCLMIVPKRSVTLDKIVSSFLLIRISKNIKIIFFLIWICSLGFLVSPIRLSAEEWVKAKWVADGDTIILEDGKLIRYMGIDAPEIDHKTNTAEPYGFISREFNKNLVLSGKLRLEFDQRMQDRYGRQLAYVFLENGVFVNQALIENGYAFYLYQSANLKYHDLFIKKQQEAMAAKKGIWKNWREKSKNYIGNVNSKRFHLPSCPYGKKTAPKNLVVFESSRDAFRRGYSPCRQCLNIGDLTSHDP
jgi:micrococcal nuclease